MKILFSITMFLNIVNIFAQEWQQHTDYKMDISVDTKNYSYDGKMDFTYYNNSPYELKELYFHLYFNAFRPGSVMDQRLYSIKDPDTRMVRIGKDGLKHSRINDLSKENQGYYKIINIKQNGKKLDFQISGTIMKVKLNKPIKSKSSTKLTMKWLAHIPSIIRRAGKLNEEGVELSMAQWYPKVAAYDRAGWHIDEYIAREFYAPFSNFDVKIELPQNYIVGASGKLLNASEMPKYGQQVKRKKNKWHFKADNIHDFVWAADPDFTVDTVQVPDGPKVYFVYQQNMKKEYIDNWKKVQPITVKFFQFMNHRFGKYPWENYTIIQAGDGGMEYGMATFIAGKSNFRDLASVIFHEGAHSWFQQLFGFNETENEWMDEGFTSYAEAKAIALVLDNKNPDEVGVHRQAYSNYYNLIFHNIEEPISILADYYNYNYTYGVSAYSKGQIFVSQLGYIIGEENLKKTFLKFYDEWKFRHPDASDFTKIASDISGINLKWYRNLFVNTTRKIDYAIDEVLDKKIKLINRSNFAMPLDVLVNFEDGSKTLYYIPLYGMRGEKTFEKEYYPNTEFKVLPNWAWTNPNYEFDVDKKIKKVEIDPTKRLADYIAENNIFVK